LFVFGCASTRTASYRYAQKQIEGGDLDFENRLRVDEYVNAFPQEDLAKPKAGDDLALQVDYFTDFLPKGNHTTLAQVAVRTRVANASEKAKKFGISLVLDNSGSMTEDNKFHDAIDALLAMITELADGTEFALVVFSNEAQVAIPPTVVTRQSRETLKEEIKKLRTEGGTNIESGLLLGYKTMSQFSKGTQSRLLLLTDGQSNVGITDPKELAKKAGVQYLEGSRISTIGLGHDVDEQLLRTIADKGRGAYYFAENATALKTLFRKDIESLMVPIAKNVTVTIKSSAGTVLKKVYGYDQPIKNNTLTLEVGELNSDDWRIFIVEVEGKDKSILTEAMASYTPATGKSALTRTTSKTVVEAGSKKPQLNKIVARNAVIFSNALTLIEVSKLDKAKKYKEAEDIVSVQLANVEVARSLDKSAELAKESDNLRKINQVLLEKQGSKTEAAQQTTQAQETSSLKPLIKSALSLAEKSIPGPWSLVIGLISLALE